MLDEQTMSDETVETLRATRADLEAIRRGWSGLIPGQNAGLSEALAGVLARLPKIPPPEAAPGPYRTELRDGTWRVESAANRTIAADVPDEPTAETLASGWKARKTIREASELLNRQPERCQSGNTIDARRVLGAAVAEHLA